MSRSYRILRWSATNPAEHTTTASRPAIASSSITASIGGPHHRSVRPALPRDEVVIQAELLGHQVGLLEPVPIPAGFVAIARLAACVPSSSVRTGSEWAEKIPLRSCAPVGQPAQRIGYAGGEERDERWMIVIRTHERERGAADVASPGSRARCRSRPTSRTSAAPSRSISPLHSVGASTRSHRDERFRVLHPEVGAERARSPDPRSGARRSRRLGDASSPGAGTRCRSRRIAPSAPRDVQATASGLHGCRCSSARYRPGRRSVRHDQHADRRVAQLGTPGRSVPSWTRSTSRRSVSGSESGGTP